MKKKELFMVHTDDMHLIAYQKTMAEALKMSYVTFNSETDFRELIPIMKTGKKENEYIELITGTLFYETDVGFVSKDALVYFTTLFDYNRDSLDNLSKEYSLERPELEMKLIYRKNKVMYSLYKNGANKEVSKEDEIIKKLQQKHKSKINTRK